jgi:hypothetical protein
MRQYLRKVRATFAGSGGGLVINPGPLQVHELKIGFNIQKDISGVPNSAVIEIWNLSEGHRNAVGKELDDVTLEAGYMPAVPRSKPSSRRSTTSSQSRTSRAASGRASATCRP